MGCYLETDFFLLFLSNLFSIGKSSGSLIIEAINLFRMFQRITIVRSFTINFSSKFLSSFKWASDFIDLITESLFGVMPLKKIETFFIIAYAFPITIAFMMSVLIVGYKILMYIYIHLALVIFGFGLGMIEYDLKFSLILIGASLVFIIGFIIYLKCCFLRKVENADSRETCPNCPKIYITFFRAVLLTTLIFNAVTITVSLQRYKLQIYIIAISSAFIVFSFIIELFLQICRNEDDLIDNENFLKFLIFLVNLLSLLIIPSTENFAILMNSSLYKNNYRIIIGYVVNSLIFPVLITIMLILSNYPTITSKYKDNNLYCYIEFVDIVRQIAYAIVAEFDIIWACIGIEIFWFLLILILRPYVNKSDYSLAFGNSFVLLVTNGTALYANMHNTLSFSFAVSLTFLILACIPSIVSIYLYFIFDFDDNLYDDDYNVRDEKFEYMFYGVGFVATPITLVVFGMYIPLLMTTI